MSLFKHHLNIALRIMLRNKMFTFINIFGLTLGMTVSILIFLWVQDELSYNSMHQNIENIYLIRSWYRYGDHNGLESGSPPAVAAAIKSEREEVRYAARFINGISNYVVSYNSIQFKEGFTQADPDIFNIFTFEFLYGSPELAYQHDQVIVMTEKIARKYFGDRNPVGESLLVNHQYEFTVAGVVKDIPHNSTIRFDIWIPIEFTKKTIREDYLDTWYNLAFRSYVLMKPGTDIGLFNKDLIDRVKQSDPNTNISCVLYPFKDQYLRLWGGLKGIILFSTIAFLILLIACINYINLTTAKSIQRFKEAALKKVAGAQKTQLISQFTGESILLALIALGLSMIAVELLLPFFNTLINKPLSIHYLDNISYILLLIGIVILVGIVAGLYPSIQISRVRPILVTSSHVGNLRSGKGFRQGLVISQFALSIILIITTIFIYRQLKYMQSKELGLSKDHLVYLPLEGKIDEHPIQFRNEVLKNSTFKSATLVSGLPTGIYWNGEGWKWPGKDAMVDPLVTILCADQHFLETFDIPLKSGNFLSDNPGYNVVINEAFEEIISDQSALGTTLWHGDDHETQYTVTGVVRNFHFKPLYNPVEPLFIFNEGEYAYFNYLIIKFHNANIQESLATLKNIYKSFNPDFPFDFHFLDEDYDMQYSGFRKLNMLVGIFALLGVLISCLGLFGLSSFLTIQRTKEIGIRKVNGAFTYQIALMLSKYFIKYVIIGFLVAIPISLIIVRSWLTNFAFKANLAWWVFALTGLLTILVAVMTVSYQSIKAALKNPADSLRYE